MQYYFLSFSNWTNKSRPQEKQTATKKTHTQVKVAINRNNSITAHRIQINLSTKWNECERRNEQVVTSFLISDLIVWQQMKLWILKEAERLNIFQLFVICCLVGKLLDALSFSHLMTLSIRLVISPQAKFLTMTNNQRIEKLPKHTNTGWAHIRLHILPVGVGENQLNIVTKRKKNDNIYKREWQYKP